MKNAGVELYYNGKNWVLNILVSETAAQEEIHLTDAEADKLKAIGVPVYDADAE